jgi:AbrB family looped-hinge helix DNA binding protein
LPARITDEWHARPGAVEVKRPGTAKQRAGAPRPSRARMQLYIVARSQSGDGHELVRLLRGGQVTLPAEVRQKLKLAQGDYLEAEVVENGVLLKPVSDVAREKAWRRVLEAPKSVRYISPKPRPSPEEEEQWLADEIEAARLEEHAKRRR